MDTVYVKAKIVNLCQRCIDNPNPMKLGRCIKERIYGLTNGGDRKSDEKIFHLKNSDNPNTQAELAKKYNITQQTMNNYMRLAKAIPELEDLVDTGIVTKDTALADIIERETGILTLTIRIPIMEKLKVLVDML